MQIILKEEQLRKLLTEGSDESIVSYLKQLKEFASNVIEKANSDMGVNLKMLSIWGAGVGGIMEPLNGFIHNGNFNLTEYQSVAILCATTAILLNENSKNISKLLKIIKEEDIESSFNIVLSKGKELKEVFTSFIESLNITLYTITNIMSYAFIIPLLPLIWEISQSGVDKEIIKEISIRILSFSLVSISGNMIKELLTKLINRFRV
jgi:hypothetical protein